MIKKDDRNELQKNTHYIGVVARDSFMSGWGCAKGGNSRVAWAVESYDHADKLFAWVKSRKEMKNVNIVNLNDYRAPRGTEHFHIYVAGKNHPAIG